MTKRNVDINGFITIDRNPITRAGVFMYVCQRTQDGSPSLPGGEIGKAYKVLRPPDEVFAPEAMKSYQNLPLIDEHTMIGDGATAPEQKGVHGWTGTEVERGEDDVCYAPLRIVGEKVKNHLARDKKGLSIGYRCSYDKVSGTYKGESYDYIQRNVRANHIALCQRGRMGADIAVLDAAFDSFEANVTEEITLAALQSTVDALHTTVSSLSAQVNNMAKGEDTMPEAKDELAEKEKLEKEAEDKADKEAKDAAEKAEKEAADKAAKDAETKEKEGEQSKAAMDALEQRLNERIAANKPDMKAVLAEVRKADALAEQLKPLIGAFDHDGMDSDEVAAYGAKQLKLEATKGQEQAVLNGYLAGRKANAKRVTAGDAAETKKTGSLWNQTLSKHK